MWTTECVFSTNEVRNTRRIHVYTPVCVLSWRRVYYGEEHIPALYFMNPPHPLYLEPLSLAYTEPCQINSRVFIIGQSIGAIEYKYKIFWDKPSNVAWEPHPTQSQSHSPWKVRFCIFLIALGQDVVHRSILSCHGHNEHVSYVGKKGQVLNQFFLRLSTKRALGS